MVNKSRVSRIVVRHGNHSHRKIISWRPTADEMIKAIEVEGIQYLIQQWNYFYREIEVAFQDLTDGSELVLQKKCLADSIKVIYKLADHLS